MPYSRKLYMMFSELLSKNSATLMLTNTEEGLKCSMKISYTTIDCAPTKVKCTKLYVRLTRAQFWKCSVVVMFQISSTLDARLPSTLISITACLWHFHFKRVSQNRLIKDTYQFLHPLGGFFCFCWTLDLVSKQRTEERVGATTRTYHTVLWLRSVNLPWFHCMVRISLIPPHWYSLCRPSRAKQILGLLLERNISLPSQLATLLLPR